MSQETDYIYAVNNTGAQIREGYITHATQDYGVQTINLSGLANGAQTPSATMYTGPSSRDYWYIAWTNDGTNWVAWCGINAIDDHESPGAPGSVTVFGQLGQSGLQVTFVTDGDTSNTYGITNPWS